MRGTAPKKMLIRLVCEKTKISRIDVEDMLRVLPQCMAEAFIAANEPERSEVNIGCAMAYWVHGSRWGPYIAIKPTLGFKAHLLKLKIDGKYPLAKMMGEMMHPKNRQLAEQKANEKAGMVPLVNS